MRNAFFILVKNNYFNFGLFITNFIKKNTGIVDITGANIGANTLLIFNILTISKITPIFNIYSNM